jgi:hypothetical protein
MTLGFWTGLQIRVFLERVRKSRILDGVAGTCIVGKGWDFLSVTTLNGAIIVGFDHETAIKEILHVLN